MKFRARKVYGQYKQLSCPFCSSIATLKNEQGLDVCHRHAKSILKEFRCTCGSWLEIKSGKFGPYFNCINCGNINYKKGIEIRTITKQGLPSESETNEKILPAAADRKERKETIITSRDVEYFD